MTARERLSVHNVTFLGADTTELHRNWVTLGLRHLSVLDTQLLDPAFVRLIRTEGYTVEAVYHLFGGGAALSRLIDAAAATDARCIYMLTGGRDGLTWEQAAETFCRAIEPCVRQAGQAGVGLAIENASSLYADIHLAHSLRDTITLAELAGLGICVDLFHCWAEADLAGLLRRALPRTQLIQLSDYVLGDRALPARAVPGDGAIPIEPFVAQALAEGYRFGFDLELLGPRIDAEGRLAAAARACAAVSAILDGLGG
ncbi:xylose isomerase [Mycobacterium sp. 1554424.7]|nr:xylose isomerase [Mycobacterium sp. 1554424.7]